MVLSHRGLLQVLHSTVVEILLFMTPNHRADIIASLLSSLNAAYGRFRRRNPAFAVGASAWLRSIGRQ